MSQEMISDWLESRGAPAKEASQVAHTVRQWAESENPDPRISTVKRLAQLAKLSIDYLVEAAPAEGSPVHCRREMMRAFVAQARELSCYLISAPQRTFDQWRATAASGQELPVAERASVAAEWAMHFKLQEMSPPLRQKLRLFNDERLRKQTLRSLIDRVLEWVPPAGDGEQNSADEVRQAMYLRVYDAVAAGERRGITLNHCVDPGDGEAPVESLRLDFDKVPLWNDPAWLVYHHWRRLKPK